MDTRSTKAYAVFLSQLSEYQDIAAAIAKGDFPQTDLAAEELIREFHKLKGSAGFFGHKPLADLAAELESSFKEIIDSEQKELIKTLASWLNDIIEKINNGITE